MKSFFLFLFIALFTLNIFTLVIIKLYSLGEIKQETKCGHFAAIVAEITGKGSHVTGNATFTLEDGDKITEGLAVT